MKQKNRVIRICSGAGCKAWNSESMARKLEGQSGGRVRVCRVSCMKNCGGGFSVVDSSAQKIMKIRQPDEAIRILFAQGAQAAMA